MAATELQLTDDCYVLPFLSSWLSQSNSVWNNIGHRDCENITRLVCWIFPWTELWWRHNPGVLAAHFYYTPHAYKFWMGIPNIHQGPLLRGSGLILSLEDYDWPSATKWPADLGFIPLTYMDWQNFRPLEQRSACAAASASLGATLPGLRKRCETVLLTLWFGEDKWARTFRFGVIGTPERNHACYQLAPW